MHTEIIFHCSNIQTDSPLSSNRDSHSNNTVKMFKDVKHCVRPKELRITGFPGYSFRFFDHVSDEGH